MSTPTGSPFTPCDNAYNHTRCLPVSPGGRHGHIQRAPPDRPAGRPLLIDHIAPASGKISPESTHVIIHDAARPAVAYADIDALMEMAEKNSAITLAAASRNALIEVDEGGNALAIHPATQYMQ